MFNFEFTVEGPPVSQQAHLEEGIDVWRAAVRWAAEQYWPGDRMPCEGSLELNITYYYESIALETSSIAQPIQDALIGLVFYNNTQIRHTHVSKQNLNSSFRIPELSPVLAAALCHGTEFIYIRIADRMAADRKSETDAPEKIVPETIEQPLEHLADQISDVMLDQINNQESREMAPEEDPLKPAWEKFLKITQEIENEIDWDEEELMQTALEIEGQPDKALDLVDIDESLFASEDESVIFSDQKPGDDLPPEPDQDVDKESSEPELMGETLDDNLSGEITSSQDGGSGEMGAAPDEHGNHQPADEPIDAFLEDSLADVSDAVRDEVFEKQPAEPVEDPVEDAAEPELIYEAPVDGADGDSYVDETVDQETNEPERIDEPLDDYWDSGIDLDQDDGVDDWPEEYEE